VSIRRTVDDAVTLYLNRQGKVRWCEKSLDTVVNADLLAQIWPNAQFICLTRHCMDMIWSAVEATRWGLSGYGFNQYAARTPTNSVAALGDYWLERTRAIVGFHKRFSERSFLMRYEDLVSRPEEKVSELFDFLSVEKVPGITEACFQSSHEAGPGDEKIWLTRNVHASSIGRGAEVPAKLMPLRMKEVVNLVLGELKYEQVDDDWNNRVRYGASPNADNGPASHAGPMPPAEQEETPEVILRKSGERLAGAGARWPLLSGRRLGVGIRMPDSAVHEAAWLIGAEASPDNGSADGADVTITGDLAAWQSVLNGTDNMVSACVTGRLRVAASGSRIWPEVADEAHAIAYLLGLNPVPVARSPLSIAVAAGQRAHT
jgi:Sulfotransferase family